jgi:hypothetical protein
MSDSESVIRAQQQLRDLEQRWQKLSARADKIAEERKGIGFRVFADGDAKARKQLDALNAEGATLSGELETQLLLRHSDASNLPSKPMIVLLMKQRPERCWILPTSLTRRCISWARQPMRWLRRAPPSPRSTLRHMGWRRSAPLASSWTSSWGELFLQRSCTLACSSKPALNFLRLPTVNRPMCFGNMSM